MSLWRLRTPKIFSKPAGDPREPTILFSFKSKSKSKGLSTRGVSAINSSLKADMPESREEHVFSFESKGRKRPPSQFHRQEEFLLTWWGEGGKVTPFVLLRL